MEFKRPRRAAKIGLCGVMLSGAVIFGSLADTHQSEDRFPYQDTVNRYFGKPVVGSSKIIEGEPAEYWDNPWQVALLVSFIADDADAQFCGGSILDKSWVVTAAHCVDDMKATDLHVLAGAADLGGSDGRRHNVEAIYVHEDYGASVLDSDIALLKIRGGLSAGAHVSRVDADGEASLAPPGTDVKVSGWGKTESGDSPEELRELTVRVVSPESCADVTNERGDFKYKDILTENMICAGNVGQGACHGDSGGPLTVLDKMGRAHLVGVVSWGGLPCAEGFMPTVYARVSRFHDWLDQCMADPATCPAKL